ncbi:hypothetical protein M433DRAFT_158048, partial [Acidomyces richmondensis BFW]
MQRPASSGNGLRPPELRESHATPPRKMAGPTSVTDLSACASPGDRTIPSHQAHRKRRQREHDDSLGAMLRRGIVDHQLGLSVNLMLFVGFSYALFPSLREKMGAFFCLSYPSNTQDGMYNLGSRDLYPVASFIVFFTALRASALEYLLLPLAGKLGIKQRKGRVRFAEQAYMMIYYALYWGWGLALFINDTPSSVKSFTDLLISLWRDFPRLHVGAGMKIYYLSQIAFWIQQIVVLHIEERRKDHYQMLSHHIITVILLCGSYPFRQWRVGNAVLVCMDIIDFIFPLAKILKYLGYQTACDAAFALFVVLWLVFRHVAYLSICWSIYAHVSVVTMPYGVYSTISGARLSDNGGTNILDNMFQPMIHPHAETVSFNANIRFLFLGLLSALQLITIGWFFMICRVVMRVIRGQGADDTRSDDEEEMEAEEETSAPSFSPIRSTPNPETEKPRFIEIESSSEDVSFIRSHKMHTTSKRKSKGISSSLNLGDHKDILNRIGCLSEEQLAREREKREESTSPRPGTSAAGR